MFLDEFKDTKEGEDMEGDNEGGWDVDDEDLDLPDLVRNTICRRGPGVYNNKLQLKIISPIQMGLSENHF